VTADVVQGAAAADRTAAQLFKKLLEDAGYTSSDYVAADLTALDAAAPYELGDWVFEERTLAAELDAIASSVGAAWYVDQTGKFRIVQFTPPTSTAALTLTANDLLRPLERLALNDPGGGLPAAKTIVDYARNFAVQATDLAGGVTDDRRAWLAAEWRQAVASDAAVETAHPMAPQTEEASLLQTAADAEAEADRRQVLRGMTRECYQARVEMNAATRGLDLHDVVELRHSRFGLGTEGSEVGRFFRVIGLAPDCAKRELTITLWGPNAGLENRVTDEGAYRVTDEGAYRITAEEVVA
jgi:hypothetical protein